jgi:hypothetical protein
MRRSQRLCTIPAKRRRDDHLGLPRQMEASNNGSEFIAAALAAYGVEGDEIELAVMAAAHEIFWPPILELLELDTSAVADEPDLDLSRAPQNR